jgi:hypothetical protein
MGRALIFLLGVCCFITSQTCHGQIIQVSDPRLELRDNAIHITYDILNSSPSDEFKVDLLITDADGNEIKASALSGDIGDMVEGGNNKHIIWDLDVDKIEMNAKIYVKVNVKAISPPVPIAVVPSEEETNGGTEEKTAKEKSFNRTAIILQSVAFPGLGLSRITGNPHWIRGVAGYGCIAGSVIMNRKAINTYGGISDLEDYDEKDELYQKSLSQDNISEVLAYAAIGIWVSDIIWTLVGTTGPNNKSLFSDVSGFSLRTTFEPISSAPMVVFAYRF